MEAISVFEELELVRLQRKIEQIDDEIRTLNRGIEEETEYINETRKSSDKLYGAKDNLMGISNKLFEKISFLRSAEYLKSEMQTAISGSVFETAENRIYVTMQGIEEKKQKHQKTVQDLKKMKKKYEKQLAVLKQEMMEAD